MTSKFSTVKLNSGLVADARREAEIFHRSLGSQIEHWARIGKAVENAEGVSVSRVRDALQGRLKIDELSDPERDAFFGEFASVFESPSPEVIQTYADRGEQLKAARAARQASRARGAA